MSGEDEYYLTTLESVVEFIHGLSEKDLKMDEASYKSRVKKAREDVELGKCMENLRIRMGDTRDASGRGRFFPVQPTGLHQKEQMIANFSQS